MVAGFIVFWPLGLAMLAYMLWGDRMRAGWSGIRPDLERAAHRAGFHGRRRGRDDRDSAGNWAGSWGSTGNSAFDAYRDAELRRLEEERAELDRMRDEFDEFLGNLRRARDQEEFDRFKASRKPSAG